MKAQRIYNALSAQSDANLARAIDIIEALNKYEINENRAQKEFIKIGDKEARIMKWRGQIRKEYNVGKDDDIYTTVDYISSYL